MPLRIQDLDCWKRRLEINSGSGSRDRGCSGYNSADFGVAGVWMKVYETKCAICLEEVQRDDLNLLGGSKRLSK